MLKRGSQGADVVRLRQQLLACERDITAGELRANDAYDLLLYQLADGNFEVVIGMRLQFFFEPGSGGHWTEAEQHQYVCDWHEAVRATWGGQRIHQTACGRSVTLRLDFEIQLGGFMLDHWEIVVTKIAPGTFRASHVDGAWGNVSLDSEDLTPLNKGGPRSQRTAVHEFGHMLGLDDEYLDGSSHLCDKASIMNTSETVRARHHQTVLDWVIRKLAAHDIR